MNKQAILDDAKEKMFLVENDFGMSNAVITMTDLYKILTAYEGEKCEHKWDRVELWLCRKCDRIWMGEKKPFSAPPEEK